MPDDQVPDSSQMPNGGERSAGDPGRDSKRDSNRGGSESKPARGDVPGQDHTLGEQVAQELDARDVPRPGAPGNPNTAPAAMGIDVARLFEQASEQTRMAICVTDPNLPDNPIVYVNQAFVTMTGYDREEAVGRNCKFLQGKDTDPTDVQSIREVMEDQVVGVVEILNYRKDGTPFWNSLHIGPIYDKSGKLTHFYGSQWDVTNVYEERAELIEERRRSALRRKVAEELQHRTNNLFAVLTAIVRLSARGETDAQSLERRVTERIGAMARAHEASIAPGGVAGAPAHLRVLADAVLQPYRMEAKDRIELVGDDVVLPEAAVTPLGLTLHELATNALKYGALSVSEGHVELSWTLEPPGEDAPAGSQGVLCAVWTETHGPAPDTVPDEAGGSGSGSRLVRGVLRAVEGSMEQDWRDTGLVVTLRMPLMNVRRADEDVETLDRTGGPARWSAP